MSTQGSAEFVDYYQLLGIAPSAELGLIRRAYINKAKEHHPDAGGSDTMMKLLNTAYRTLTDANRKAAYDMLHSIETGTAHSGQYKYQDGREVSGVEDMTDDEIDDFLDSMLTEYQYGSQKEKLSVASRLKNIFKTL